MAPTNFVPSRAVYQTMARLLLCIALVLGPAGCSDDPQRVRAPDSRLAEAREALQVLGRDLAAARDRVDELERQVDVEQGRYVDLWGGGPTMRGPLLALPRLGAMRWKCDDDFGFRIVFEPAGATVEVDLDYSTDAAGSHRPLHPGQSLGATIAAGETVSWRITSRHPPGFIRAHVDVTAERSKQGSCILPSIRLRESARVYE